MTDVLMAALTEIVGEKNVLATREHMEDYSHDEFALPVFRNYPEAVVRPATVEETSRIVRLLNQHAIPITPRGGGTGLCGACVPCPGGIVLDMQRINRILEIDTGNFMAVLEAGVTLAGFYEELRKKDLFFPPHPGDENAMIGGLIATNAGGARAVKYGTIRNFVRGLEVVLADGSIINLGGKVMKNSSGYNLLHLMIGSEGTLGIITKAVISIMPPRRHLWTLLVPYEDLASVMNSVVRILHAGIVPLALEFLEHDVVEITAKSLGKSWPCKPARFYLMIMLDGSTEEEIEKTAEPLAELCLADNAMDILVADTGQKQKDILEIRSQFYEALKPDTLEILDIVVPRTEIAHHVAAVAEISERYGVWLPTYGHAADGNVHTHIMKPVFREGKPRQEREDWHDYYPKIKEEIHRDALSRGGYVSGEHGIGLAKKELLPLFLPEKQIELMRGIKRCFDPNNIMNPGKIFKVS